jgi:hypothetical protein
MATIWTSVAVSVFVLAEPAPLYLRDSLPHSAIKFCPCVPASGAWA